MAQGGQPTGAGARAESSAEAAASPSSLRGLSQEHMGEHAFRLGRSWAVTCVLRVSVCWDPCEAWSPRDEEAPCVPSAHDEGRAGGRV